MIYCEKNFLFWKLVSDLDIGLVLNVVDSEYLGVVDDILSYLLNILNLDLVFYDVGVDVW